MNNEQKHGFDAADAVADAAAAVVDYGYDGDGNGYAPVTNGSATMLLAVGLLIVIHVLIFHLLLFLLLLLLIIMMAMMLQLQRLVVAIIGIVYYDSPDVIYAPHLSLLLLLHEF